MTKARPTIGWREWLALPGLGVERIKAKIDTGARSSTLHAFDVEHFERDGCPWVRFQVHPRQRDTTESLPCEAELVDERLVRSSVGQQQLRPVVRTEVHLMGQTWPIEVTLTRRDVMGFRMLIGRQALRGRFVVDPGRSFVGGRPGRERRGSAKKGQD